MYQTLKPSNPLSLNPSEQRQLTDALGTVVLIGAGVGHKAMLPSGGGGLAVAQDFFHQGYIVFYLGVLRL